MIIDANVRLNCKSEKISFEDSYRCEYKIEL